MKGLEWFKVASNIAFDGDIQHVSDAEFRTFFELIGISAFHLSDGRVLLRTARKLCNTRRLTDTLAALSKAGYITLDADEIVITNYTKYQQTRQDVECSRRQNKRRVELFRSPELQQAIRERDGDFCRYCGQEVNWKDRRSPSGATYDHVDPEGPNTLDNLVVCCRGCNSSKGGRTPEEAGMKLITAPHVTNYNQVQSKSKSKSKNRKENHRRENPAEDGFEEFWSLYPRHVGGKSKAKQCWVKALKVSPASAIMQGLRDQLPGWAGKEAEFIPYPTTWLNAGRWTDEVSVKRNGNGGPSRSFTSEEEALIMQAVGMYRTDWEAAQDACPNDELWLEVMRRAKEVAK